MFHNVYCSKFEKKSTNLFHYMILMWIIIACIPSDILKVNLTFQNILSIHLASLKFRISISLKKKKKAQYLLYKYMHNINFVLFKLNLRFLVNVKCIFFSTKEIKLRKLSWEWNLTGCVIWNRNFFTYKSFPRQNWCIKQVEGYYFRLENRCLKIQSNKMLMTTCLKGFEYQNLIYSYITQNTSE